MTRPLVLIPGSSATAEAFLPLRKALTKKGIVSTEINICNYVSLNAA
jgi:hypothetical protein